MKYHDMSVRSPLEPHIILLNMEYRLNREKWVCTYIFVGIYLFFISAVTGDCHNVNFTIKTG